MTHRFELHYSYFVAALGCSNTMHQPQHRVEWRPVTTLLRIMVAAASIIIGTGCQPFAYRTHRSHTLESISTGERQTKSNKMRVLLPAQEVVHPKRRAIEFPAAALERKGFFDNSFISPEQFERE